MKYKLKGERANLDRNYVIYGLELFKTEEDRMIFIKNDKNDSDKFTFYYVYPIEKLIYFQHRKGYLVMSGFLDEIVQY